ncbi:uncharacterized protein K452DRAFT_284458 [Aplosporella prunicola CBS 121167]|uniref:Uncharacterized protein n=1 Tax=Aplosporella prunicola CBS 121167 TaxID=1176127 RepID=A0A6A6BR58_9PEZI|nr:uncharacterized protein K452DRAFT_284458 [Aplosporella prunicola CBS 121167]KAF2145071.1 hypothetical protein K452DRAFT_284458 [Aplosporella prunicola CBS 121167]
MPRDGSGHGDNSMEFDPAVKQNITHGVGADESAKVARADKTATPPPGEKGFAIEGLGGSGGASTGQTGTRDLSAKQ